MTEIIAHRGFATENPENTVAAVEAAAWVADAVEIDIRRCGTGELVVFHDETLDRLTSETGRIAETPFDTLCELDVAKSGEPIPVLDEIFRTVPEDTSLYLHLKEPGLADEVLDLHADYDHDIVCSSEDPTVLTEIPLSVPTAYAIREVDDVDSEVKIALATGCDEIHPHHELCLETSIVQRAHRAGLDVAAWTIRTEKEFAAVMAAGVDAMHSDITPGISIANPTHV